ncbi:effector protein Tle3 domain-containing protein, partial [Xanthomonas cerealis]
PEWRKLLIAFANWRTPFIPSEDQPAGQVSISELANFKKLSPGARELVEACCLYYEKGVFPARLVSDPPPVDYVVSKTRAQRAESNE